VAFLNDMRRIGQAAACAGALLVAGCGAQMEGVLVPQASVPDANRVDILVATTRSPDTTTPGVLFSGERGRGMNYADISISIPPDAVRKIGDVQWPQSLPADPSREFATLRAEVDDLNVILPKFNARLRKIPSRRVLVFVHGYNTRFEEAVYRFAQIAHDSNAPAVPVLFTWPSRGKLLAYGYDRESAAYSRDALERLLQVLADDREVREIAVLAHSMGNWTTLEALRQMAIRKGRISPKIRDVMLAAPDVDFDVFRRQIAEIGPERPPFTLFVSRDDDALAVSKRVWGSEARVGQIDPNADPYKNELERGKVVAIDLTDVQSSDSMNHAKFAAAPEVVQAIGKRISSGQTLTDSRGGIGEHVGAIAFGAAATVGTAAGVVVSAPFAIVDKRTRDSLGDRVQSVGDHFGSTLSSAKSAATPQ
jgi:esterase/lipase superfamily enzyme